MYKISEISLSDYNLYVGLLTIEQKDMLVGQLYMPDSYFNPIQDADNNWVISVEEISQCVNTDFIWVKDLQLIEYKPKQSDILI